MNFSRLFKIKEGKLEKFRSWMDQLSASRREEAIATFAYENVTRETFALFKGYDGTYYVVGLNEANGQLRQGDPSVPINQEHSIIKKECLEPISETGEILLDLSSRNDA